MKILESPVIIAILMKSARVRKSKWLKTKTWEEDRYSKQIEKDKKKQIWKK